MQTRVQIQKNETAAPGAPPAAPPVAPPAAPPPAAPPAAAPSAKKLDDAMTALDQLVAQPTEKTFATAADFEKYVEEQTTKAAAEIAAGHSDRAQKRVAALKLSVTAAKAVLYAAAPATQLEAGATAKSIPVYVDPWILLPTAPVQMSEKQPPTGESNIVFPPTPTPAPGVTKAVLRKSADGKSVQLVDAFREAVLVAKALEGEKGKTSKVRAQLAKAGDAGKVLLEKASGALQVLQKIQAMFAITLDDPADIYDWEFRCQIGDIVSSLQSAAQVDKVMDQMAPMMDGGGADTVKAAAEAAKAAEEKAAQEKAALEKSDEDAPWPLDLAAPEPKPGEGVDVDTREPVQKGAKPLYWGRDNETAPVD